MPSFEVETLPNDRRVILLGGLSLLLMGVCLPGCAPPSDVNPDTGNPVPQRLELVSEWGCLDCTGPELLTPFFITMTSEGILYELDWYEPFVRVFDREGAPLLGFGEKGEGPGQLGSSVPGAYIPGFAAWPDEDGSILVFQPMPAVITRFSAEGEYLEELALEAPRGIPMNFAYDARRRSFLLVTGATADPAISRFELGGPNPTEAVALLTDPENLPRRGDDPQRAAASFAFAATPDGGFIIGDTWRYEIRVFDSGGQPTGAFGRDIARPSKTEEEIEEALANATTESRRERAQDPEKHHFGQHSFRYDDSGHLWVATGRSTASVTVFDIFGPEGEFLGELEIEAELKDRRGRGEAYGAFAVSGGHLAAVTVHDSGNDQIKVWRLVYSEDAR